MARAALQRGATCNGLALSVRARAARGISLRGVGIPGNSLAVSLVSSGQPLSAAGQPRAPRRSACAASSREKEMERIRRMSVEERIAAALTMGDRFSWLKPRSGKPAA